MRLFPEIASRKHAAVFDFTESRGHRDARERIALAKQKTTCKANSFLLSAFGVKTDTCTIAVAAIVSNR